MEKSMTQLTGNATIVDHSLRETTTHGTEGFPFAVYLDDFSNFQNGFICWHWHEEVQITVILEGNFTCQIGSDKVLMKPGELIFINSRALHQICPVQKSYGKLYSFIWRADMLAGNTECDLFCNCIEHVIRSNRNYIFWDRENQPGKQLRTSLLRIVNIMTEKAKLYELRVYHQLARIWLELSEYLIDTERYETHSGVNGMVKARDEERVRNAMQYMQEFFDRDISLEDIARAAMTNRSELCKSFRRTLDTSPKEFLLQYRIRQSLILLENPNLRIADISEMTGFCSPSHYGLHFQKHMGCTPLQYRKSLLQ